MGNANSGRKPLTRCPAEGHDLTDPANVKIVRRKGKPDERACKPCAQRRAREWWQRQRGKMES
jgi:hypothetical protein